MIARPLSLRVWTQTLAFAAALLGGAVVWIWMQSNAEWRAHQARAYNAGVLFYTGLQNGTAQAKGVSVALLSDADRALARAGRFRDISGVPRAARETFVPVLADAANARTGAPLTMVILSPDLVYPLADLPNRAGQTAAETTGAVFRTLASYCSDPVVIAQLGRGPWVRVEAAAVWGCDAAPPICACLRRCWRRWGWRCWSRC
ncbi:hypothetical protein [Sulfitobacter albidus]|uniref:hypothetical protein n=1 Tax=Sulfitobacter albidus TaxID=2829501 RepID=UPI0020C901E5|nr:hypothetical protein [Sulfitobacter albidus]